MWYVCAWSDGEKVFITNISKSEGCENKSSFLSGLRAYVDGRNNVLFVDGLCTQPFVKYAPERPKATPNVARLLRFGLADKDCTGIVAKNCRLNTVRPSSLSCATNSWHMALEAKTIRADVLPLLRLTL